MLISLTYNNMTSGR